MVAKEIENSIFNLNFLIKHQILFEIKLSKISKTIVHLLLKNKTAPINLELLFLLFEINKKLKLSNTEVVILIISEINRLKNNSEKLFILESYLTNLIEQDERHLGIVITNLFITTLKKIDKNSGDLLDSLETFRSQIENLKYITEAKEDVIYKIDKTIKEIKEKEKLKIN